jgi:hypothetical protein
MTDKLKETIKEELIKTPAEAQEAITTSNWENISQEIATKYELNEEETNILQGEIGLAVLGITRIDEFTDNIEANIVTTKNNAQKITDEIFEKIFTPIANKISEQIKTKDKNTNWKQNIEFILSGGNYFCFMKWPEKTQSSESDIKINTPTPSKIDDLKSKFTI